MSSIFYAEARSLTTVSTHSWLLLHLGLDLKTKMATRIQFPNPVTCVASSSATPSTYIRPSSMVTVDVPSPMLADDANVSLIAVAEGLGIANNGPHDNDGASDF